MLWISELRFDRMYYLLYLSYMVDARDGLIRTLDVLSVWLFVCLLFVYEQGYIAGWVSVLGDVLIWLT